MVKKRKLTARKLQNIFSLLKGEYSFFAKNNYLTVIGTILFATPGPLTFFILTTVCPPHISQMLLKCKSRSTSLIDMGLSNVGQK